MSELAGPGDRERLAALDLILQAWDNPGPQAGYHREWQGRLRREWPTLARAIESAPRERRYNRPWA